MTIKEFEELVKTILSWPVGAGVTEKQEIKWKTHVIMKLAEKGAEEPETERHCPASKAGICAPDEKNPSVCMFCERPFLNAKLDMERGSGSFGRAADAIL